MKINLLWTIVESPIGAVKKNKRKQSYPIVKRCSSTIDLRIETILKNRNSGILLPESLDRNHFIGIKKVLGQGHKDDSRFPS